MDELELITLEYVQALLNDYEFKQLLIRELNHNIDLPFFNEKTEEKILNAVYDSVLLAINQ